MSNKNSTKKRARASNDSKATQEQQPIDGDTCEDTQSEFMEFVRSSLNNLNDKLDAFVEKQEKLELRITALAERVTSQDKAVEGVIESVYFTAEKLTNAEHSLERLEKSLADATREIANIRITVAKLSDTVSRQERHSRSFNIRVLGVREQCRIYSVADVPYATGPALLGAPRVVYRAALVRRFCMFSSDLIGLEGVT